MSDLLSSPPSPPFLLTTNTKNQAHAQAQHPSDSLTSPSISSPSPPASPSPVSSTIPIPISTPYEPLSSPSSLLHSLIEIHKQWEKNQNIQTKFHFASNPNDKGNHERLQEIIAEKEEIIHKLNKEIHSKKGSAESESESLASHVSCVSLRSHLSSDLLQTRSDLRNSLSSLAELRSSHSLLKSKNAELTAHSQMYFAWASQWEKKYFHSHRAVREHRILLIAVLMALTIFFVGEIMVEWATQGDRNRLS